MNELMGAFDWQPRSAAAADATGGSAAPDDEAVATLASAADLHPTVAAVLWQRGITTPEAVHAFLNPSLDQLCDPYSLKGMDAAVAAIEAARDAGQRVLVYGDYDVDGVASTALLVRGLTLLGLEVEYAIPDRLAEGYGLNKQAVQDAVGRGCELLITVDNGISAVAEVRMAREAGLSVVVTDHHQPPAELPPADAVVNPHQPGCSAPFRGWAGVGVTFKLVQALFAAAGREEVPLDWLDLVALGTIADLVPLTGENRILVHFGMLQLRDAPLPGITALREVAGVSADELTVRRLAFTLAPRLNAAGRLGDARPAVELLLTQDAKQAETLAQELDDENRRRQAIGQGIQQEVLAELDRHPDWLERPMLVLAAEGWHTGLVGIVASRLVDRFGRPALLLDLEDGTARGSARSVEGFNIYEALKESADLLERFGGHAGAAGVSLPAEHVEALRERLWAAARRQLPEGPPRPTLAIDGQLTLSEIRAELVNDLERLAPFGFGHPRPVFCSTGRLADVRAVGSGRHLKLRLGRGSDSLDAIAFRMGKRAQHLAAGQLMEVAFTPEWNTWQGKTQLQLHVQDLRLPPEPLQQRMLERLRLNLQLLRRRHPDRKRLAAIYKALQQIEGDQPLLTADESLCSRLKRQVGLRLPVSTLTAALTIFTEIGLMSTLQQGDATVFLFNAEPEEPLSLDESPRYLRGRRELAAAEGLLERAASLTPGQLAKEAATLGQRAQEASEPA